MHIGKKIKLIRHIKGLTQEDLAEKINKTRALVSHIEQTGKINHYTLQFVLKAFEISEEELEAVGESEIRYHNPETETKITLLEDKLEQYKKENQMLKDMVDSQKKLIRLMEGRK